MSIGSRIREKLKSAKETARFNRQERAEIKAERLKEKAQASTKLRGVLNKQEEYKKEIAKTKKLKSKQTQQKLKVLKSRGRQIGRGIVSVSKAVHNINTNISRNINKAQGVTTTTKRKRKSKSGAIITTTKTKRTPPRFPYN